MAVTYYLVAVMLLVAVVSGQGDVAPVHQYSPQEFEGLTNIDKEVISPLINSMIKNAYACEACERIVGFLKNVTEDNATLAELVKLILPLCDWAPYALHKECITSVEGLPAEVTKLANKYLDPKKDCAMLCTKNPETDAAPMANALMQMLKASKTIK